MGIAERARDAGHDVTIVHGGDQPPHEKRLAGLEERGAAVVLADDLSLAVESLSLADGETYVFGFQSFVEETKDALTAAGVDLDDVEVESFGPA